MLFNRSTTERHKDGTTTERFEDGTSITRNSDGTTKEKTKTETIMFRNAKVTYDGNDKQINAQWKK